MAVTPARKSETLRGGHELSARRLEQRALASRMVAEGLEVVPPAQVGRVLDVSRHAVLHWADPEHPAAMTLGDVLAAPRPFARRVLGSALTQVEERGPVSSAPLEQQVVSTVVGAMRLLEVVRLGGPVEQQPRSVLEQLLGLVEEVEDRLRSLKKRIEKELGRG